MTVKFNLFSCEAAATGKVGIAGSFVDLDSNTFLSTYSGALTDARLYDTKADIIAAIYADIVAKAVTLGYTSFVAADIVDFQCVAGSVTGAPQAAVADAPVDAVTNYNVLTTLLGAVTGAVNDANTKQNQIATQLNSLLAELRTLGIISA